MNVWLINYEYDAWQNITMPNDEDDDLDVEVEEDKAKSKKRFLRIKLQR